MQHHLPPQAVAYPSLPQSAESKATEAPPKQVALAMDRLSQAARLIADVRLGADRILEALFVAAQPHQISKPLHLFAKEDAAMRQHFQDLRSIGRQLEESGVINDSLRSRSNSWGLHMPLVCPDGAVVAYAWKRQLAGQAGASAVDRTRLAYKAFSDQKRRFFPHLDDGLNGQSGGPVSKRHRAPIASHNDDDDDDDDDADDYKTLSDILAHLEKEVSGVVKVFTYDRLDWLKRASSLPASTNENPMQVSKEQSFHTLNRLRTSSVGPSATTTTDKVAIIELFCPSIFRAIVSLHPAGSTDPDAVAFFSPDEGGSYVHARGHSVHHVFKHITDHAETALQYFLGGKADTALYSILHWICSYRTLFTKVCSKCGRLLAMDKRSAVVLPPVYRSYRNLSNAEATSLEKDQIVHSSQAYHADCYLEEQ